MNEPFNPYAEWLDLPADLRSPNHYELLQLTPGEADQQTIVAAADRAMVKVRGYRPGKRAADWAMLLDRLSDAKKCLSDPAKRAAYDQRLAVGPRQGAANDELPSPPTIAAVNQSADFYPPGMAPADVPTPTTPKAAASPMDAVANAATTRGKRRSTKRSAKGDVDPMAPVATPDSQAGRATSDPRMAKTPVDGQTDRPASSDVPGASVARQQAAMRTTPPTPLQESPNLVAEVPESTPINAHVSPPRKKDRSVLPMVLGVAAALAILTLALLFLATQRGGPKKSTATPPAVAERPVPNQPGGNRPSSTKPKVGPSKTGRTQPANPIILNPPDPVPGADSPQEPTTPGTAPEGAPGQDAADDSDAASEGTDVPTADDLPTENIDDPFMNDPEETPSATATPPTAEELAELSKTLTTARNAAGEHEFRIARMQLVKAGTLARLPEHQAMVARLDRLVSLSEQFWVAVRQAMSELQGAEELPIGDSGLIVIVVDVKPGVITIRRNGRNESFLVPDMPPGLAFAIADRKLDAAASDTSLMKGACLGAMKNPKQIYIDEAKRYWEIARTQGVQVDDLLLALADTYELK